MQFKTDFVTHRGVYRTIMTEKLNVPATDGRRTILSNHAPIMIPLEIGIIETIENGKLKHYAVNGGILYFRDNYAKIASYNVIDVEEIDVDEVLADKAKAQLQLEDEKYGRTTRAQMVIENSNNLLKAAEKYLPKK